MAFLVVKSCSKMTCVIVETIRKFSTAMVQICKHTIQFESDSITTYFDGQANLQVRRLGAVQLKA